MFLVLGAYNNEDDEIIQQAISDDRSEPNGYFSPIDYTAHSSTDLFKRANTPLVEEMIMKEQHKGGKQVEAENIVGDMKKYGLWEYTTDTTGMGDQIKEIMSKSQDIDASADISQQSLLKHADKMNEEINKYAEQAPTAGPTIDPYDTPLGYTTPAFTSEKQQKPSQQPGLESVDVVTIPNALTIEDEHGNNLDNLKQPGFKDSDKIEPTKTMTPIELKMTTHVRTTRTPTISVLHHKTPPPTTALTLKLLNALKNSKTFLQNAQNLLASPNDSDLDLFQKQKNLVKYLKAYEEEHDGMKQKLQVEKVAESATIKEAKPTPHKENRLMQVIQYLFSVNHPTTKSTDANPMKGSLADMESNDVKASDDINAIKSPPGTPEKPNDIKPTAKFRDAKPLPNLEKPIDNKSQDPVSNMKSSVTDSERIQKLLLDSLMKSNSNENKDENSLSNEGGEFKQFFHSKLQTQPMEETNHNKGKSGLQYQHFIVFFSNYKYKLSDEGRGKFEKQSYNIVLPPSLPPHPLREAHTKRVFCVYYYLLHMAAYLHRR